MNLLQAREQRLFVAPRRLTAKPFIVLGFLAFASVAQATVITTVEWESKPGSPWAYGGTPTAIDCAMPASPSGGCALRFTYPAGTYNTSFSAGRAEYSISGQPMDLYLGAWMRYSDPFTFHPVGHKVNFFVLAGGNGGCRNVAIGYGGSQFTGTPQICWGPGTQVYFQNAALWKQNEHLREWHWYEMRVKVNTPGGYDGVMQLWIDDVLYMSHSNVAFRDVGDTAGLGSIQHTAEWGGGGGTIPQTGYWWVDHTVISTARIGMPGGAGGPTCGDGTCNSNETCSSCANDCADCPVDGKPAPVTDLVAVANSSGSADLTFTEVDDGTGLPSKYDIRFANPPMQWGSAVSVATGTCALPVLGLQTGQTRTCTVTGLTPDTDYQFQLVSYRGTLNQDAVFGVLSNVASATTSIGGGDVESSGCNITARNSGLVGFILLSLSIVMLRMRKRVGLSSSRGALQ